MNIWIIDHYSSEPRFGGYSRQYFFALGLAGKGYDVLVVSSAFSHFSHRYIADKRINYSNIAQNANYAYLKTTPYTKNNDAKRIINMVSFVRAVKKNYKVLIDRFGKPDLVVGCSMHPLTWIAAQYVSRKTNSRFIVEVRDLWPATQIYNHGMSPYHPVALFFGKLEKWAYDHAEKIVYSMARGDRYLSGILGYPKEKLCWIDQPMDVSFFDNNAKRYNELPHEITSFIGDAFLCVFTGYYVDYEGVMEMLEAAKRLKGKYTDIKFVFVGSGRSEEQMRQYQRENDLDNVFIGGRIDRELIPALLYRADVCLVNLAVRGNTKSYQFDASKNKLTEYLFSNSVVIYGTYIQDQYVKTSGAGYTITPFSAEEFAEKIEEVYNMDSEKRKTIAENGRKYVMNHNTLEVLLKKYTDMIEGKQ